MQKKRPQVTILIANLPAERDRRVIRECLSLERNGYDVTVIAPRGDRALKTLPGSRNTRLKPYPVYVLGAGVLSFAFEFVWSFLCIAVRKHQEGALRSAGTVQLKQAYSESFEIFSRFKSASFRQSGLRRAGSGALRRGAATRPHSISTTPP